MSNPEPTHREYRTTRKALERAFEHFMHHPGSSELRILTALMERYQQIDIVSALVRAEKS